MTFLANLLPKIYVYAFFFPTQHRVNRVQFLQYKDPFGVTRKLWFCFLIATYKRFVFYCILICGFLESRLGEICPFLFFSGRLSAETKTFVMQLNNGDNTLQANDDYIIKSVILNNSSNSSQLSNTTEKTSLESQGL